MAIATKKWAGAAFAAVATLALAGCGGDKVDVITETDSGTQPSLAQYTFKNGSSDFIVFEYSPPGQRDQLCIAAHSAGNGYSAAQDCFSRAAAAQGAFQILAQYQIQTTAENFPVTEFSPVGDNSRTCLLIQTGSNGSGANLSCFARTDQASEGPVASEEKRRTNNHYTLSNGKTDFIGADFTPASDPGINCSLLSTGGGNSNIANTSCTARENVAPASQQDQSPVIRIAPDLAPSR